MTDQRENVSKIFMRHKSSLAVTFVVFVNEEELMLLIPAFLGEPNSQGLCFERNSNPFDYLKTEVEWDKYQSGREKIISNDKTLILPTIENN